MAMMPYTEQIRAPYRVSGNQGLNYIQSNVVGIRSLGGIYSVKNGDFKRPNAHRYTVSRSWGLLGVIQEFNGSYGTTRSGAQPYVFNWTIYDESFDQDIYNEAVAELYEKLRGNVDVTVDAFQWRQITKMVALHRRVVHGIAKDAEKLLPRTARVERALKILGRVDYRSRKAKQVRKELNSAVNALARARLEFVYGWMPSISTMRDLAKGALRNSEAGMIKCEGKAKTVRKRIVKQYSISSKVPLEMSITVSHRIRMKTWFNPRPGIIDNLSRISSLNPISIAYELTPFSFVLDWAVNISQFLRSMESAFVHRNEFVTGFVTRTRRLTVEASMSGLDKTGPTSGIIYNLKGVGVRTTFDRSGLAAAPFPTRPVLGLKLGVERTLNALALAKVTMPKADILISRFKK